MSKISANSQDQKNQKVQDDTYSNQAPKKNPTTDPINPITNPDPDVRPGSSSPTEPGNPSQYPVRSPNEVPFREPNEVPQQDDQPAPINE